MYVCVSYDETFLLTHPSRQRRAAWGRGRLRYPWCPECVCVFKCMCVRVCVCHQLANTTSQTNPHLSLTESLSHAHTHQHTQTSTHTYIQTCLNVRSMRADAMDTQANAPRGLGDNGALLQGVVDADDGVRLHREEEARGHLREARPGVEERWGGVDEPLVGPVSTCVCVCLMCVWV